MASGERPFRGDSVVSVLSSILRDVPRPLAELNPRLPREFTRIVRRCLAKDPDERYQSAKDLRLDLEDLRQELRLERAVARRGAGPPPASIRRCGRRGRGWSALAGGARRRARLAVAARADRRRPTARSSPRIDRITGEPGIEGAPERLARRPVGRLQPAVGRRDATSTCRRSAATGR